MFRGSVKGTGYPLRSPVSPSLPLPCVTVCYHISTGVSDYSTSILRKSKLVCLLTLYKLATNNETIYRLALTDPTLNIITQYFHTTIHTTVLK